MIETLNKDSLDLYQDIIDSPKVPMTLRIGIAGPRNITQQESSQGLLQLRNVLSGIAEELATFIEQSDIANKLYDLKKHEMPTLRLTSSLAIGVDRFGLNNEVITACKDSVNIEHAAILPFLLEDCKQGFQDSTRSVSENEQDWQVLDTLVKQIKRQSKCRLIELDGDATTPESQDTAHYRCTQFLVENIDLLIVVTKNKSKPSPNLHRAGTNATIQLAKEAGRPIIQIALTQSENKAQLTIHPAKRFGLHEEVETYTVDNVRHMLERLVLFGSLFKLDDDPSTMSDHNKNYENEKDLITSGLKHHVDDKKRLKIENGITDFNFQGVIKSPFSWSEKVMGSNVFDSFKRLLTNAKKVRFYKAQMRRADAVNTADKPQSSQPQNLREAHNWFGYFLRADTLAKRFASVHRSTYLLIYFFAAIALIIAAVALTYQDKKALVILLIFCEFLALALIYILYMTDHHNHHKWLQNRCLAEAIRPNIYLNQFGRCFSFFNIRSSDEFMYREIMGHSHSGAQWVCIQQELINRHLGFGHCRYTPSFLKQSTAFLTTAWLSGQISYHLTNAAKMQVIGQKFSKSTHWLFFLTVFALFIKAALAFEVLGDIEDSLWLTHLYKTSSLFTAIFPILGAAMFAIRNHSEFDISAQRSLTMLAFFNSIYSTISAKKCETSDCLDAELKRLTDVSAQEMSDWLEIYEVKESEPG